MYNKRPCKYSLKTHREQSGRTPSTEWQWLFLGSLRESQAEYEGR